MFFGQLYPRFPFAVGLSLGKEHVGLLISSLWTADRSRISAPGGRYADGRG